MSERLHWPHRKSSNDAVRSGDQQYQMRQTGRAVLASTGRCDQQQSKCPTGLWGPPSQLSVVPDKQTGIHVYYGWIDPPTDWPTDRPSSNWPMSSQTDGLTDRQMDGLTDQPIDQLIYRLIGWLTNWRIGQLVNWCMSVWIDQVAQTWRLLRLMCSHSQPALTVPPTTLHLTEHGKVVAEL